MFTTWFGLFPVDLLSLLPALVLIDGPGREEAFVWPPSPLLTILFFVVAIKQAWKRTQLNYVACDCRNCDLVCMHACLLDLVVLCNHALAWGFFDHSKF